MRFSGNAFHFGIQERAGDAMNLDFVRNVVVNRAFDAARSFAGLRTALHSATGFTELGESLARD